MPFQPVAATALAELIYVLDGQICENTLYFRQPNDYTAADLEALAGDVETWWIANIAPLVASALTLVRIVCTALHAQTGPQFTLTLSPAPTGAVGGDAVPNNVALCVSFRTALIGRSFRGRNFVPAISEGQTTLSRVPQAISDGFVTAYEKLITPGLGSRDWVVVSRVVNGVVQSPSALTNSVTAVVVTDNVLDSQRRRLPGRGR